MKTTIALLFLTFSIINGNLYDFPKEDSQSIKSGQDFVEQGLMDFEQDVKNSKPLEHHFLVLHEYLKDIQADNDPNGQVVQGFDAVITEANKLLTDYFPKYPNRIAIRELEKKNWGVKHLKELIKVFTKMSVKNFYLLQHAFKWLEVRRFDSDSSAVHLNDAISNLGNIIQYFENQLKWIDIHKFQPYGLLKTYESLRTTLTMITTKTMEYYVEDINSAVNGIAKLTSDSIKSKLPNRYIELHEWLKRDQVYDEHEQVLKGFNAVLTEVDKLCAQDNAEGFRDPQRLRRLIQDVNIRAWKLFALLKDPLKYMERRSFNSNFAKFAKDLRLAKSFRITLDYHIREILEELPYDPASNARRIFRLQSSLVNDGDFNLKNYTEKMNSVLNGIAELAEVSTPSEETDEAV